MKVIFPRCTSLYNYPKGLDRMEKGNKRRKEFALYYWVSSILYSTSKGNILLLLLMELIQV